ncbi:MAG TPA: hypothetical protein VGQ83_14600 [Polyangia bacterium]
MGLSRAHHAIFWDFYGDGAITWGLVAHDGTRKPLHHAYRMLAQVLPRQQQSQRVPVTGARDGRLEDGTGAVLVTRLALGTVEAQVLMVNRGEAARTAAVVGGSGHVTPRSVTLFADPAVGPVAVTPTPEITLPPRSMAVLAIRL